MEIRPVVNSKGTTIEKLEEEMAKFFTIISERLERKMITKEQKGGRKMERNNIR